MNEGRFPVYPGFARYLRDQSGIRFVPIEAARNAPERDNVCCFYYGCFYFKKVR
jgi:hypothetical protein